MILEFKPEISEEQLNFKKARQDLRVAMLREFNDIYGLDEKDIDVWRNLFHVVNHPDVPEAPGTPKACKKVRKDGV
jgi:hypothetical protein